MDYLHTNSTVSPTFSPPDQHSGFPLWVGFLTAGIAVIFFGSNFVPVKKIETGDGIFFQWVLCSGIWICGIITHAARGFPVFYALPMLGGMLWCIGNVLTVPIIQTIGLGRGILVWGSFNLLTGWASGRFGLFGLTPEVPNNPLFNYIGVSLCFLSAIVYVFVKSEGNLNEDANKCPISTNISEDDDPLLSDNSKFDHTISMGETQKSFLERLNPSTQRIIGTVFAIIAGCLYGVNFAPVIYVQNNYDCSSQNGLDYVFSHFSGIYATSTFVTLIYSGIKLNQPLLYPKALIPAFVSGIMWAIADISWFISNSTLSEAISFPIITTCPAIVGALWGVLVFKEIKGKKNLLLLILGFLITIAGAILTGLSTLGGSKHSNINSNSTKLIPMCQPASAVNLTYH